MERILPNHRVRLDVQLDMLSAFARLSGGQRPVDSGQVADLLKVGTNTVSLSSGFFVDSGWLERAGPEEYVATESLVAYHRRAEFVPGPAAVAMLAEPVRSSWYWQVLEPNLRVGSLSRYDAVVVLATEGNMAEERRPQLERLLEWLDLLGLIRVDGDDIVAAPGTAENRRSGDAVLALDIGLHLTVADLAALTPDQIRALFEAVRTVITLPRTSPGP